MSTTPTRLDPRAERTITAMQHAVITLIGRKPIQEISISEVVAEANVNRSSFYAHYARLDTLIADALEDVAIRAGERGGHSAGASSSASEAELPEAVGAYVQHLYEYAAAYRWALGPAGSAEITTRLRLRFQTSLEKGFKHHLRSAPGSDMGFSAQAAFLAGGMIGVLTAWLESDPVEKPDVLAKWLWREVRAEFASAVRRATGADLVGAE